jgi:glycosyltransferase involved in cell wall biosynthesis
MRILMIAPEPFFEPRGTPFSEYHRIRALLDLGHTVDLVTYPFGRDVELPGLRIIRSLRPPLVRRVRIGPSFAKVPLDLALAATAFRRAIAEKYDAIHSHEEGGAIGVVLSALIGVPHLYDMHSSLPQQLTNFGFSRSRILAGVFEWLERFVIRRSRVVIVICPHLLEAYQGLDLLFAAMRTVAAARPDVKLVMAGGEPAQVDQAREEASRAGVGEVTVFAGRRAAEEIPRFLDAADVLVSPRSSGTNTPLKIYQYLRSGRPIVATRLLTHTQVLDDDVALLTEATPAGFGAGILTAIQDPVRARQTGVRAQALAATKYTYDAYLGRTREACDRLFGTPATTEVAGGVA